MLHNKRIGIVINRRLVVLLALLGHGITNAQMPIATNFVMTSMIQTNASGTNVLQLIRREEDPFANQVNTHGGYCRVICFELITGVYSQSFLKAERSLWRKSVYSFHGGFTPYILSGALTLDSNGNVILVWVTSGEKTERTFLNVKVYRLDPAQETQAEFGRFVEHGEYYGVVPESVLKREKPIGEIEKALPVFTSFVSQVELKRTGDRLLIYCLRHSMETVILGFDLREKKWFDVPDEPTNPTRSSPGQKP
jgi:hypothetical protein